MIPIVQDNLILLSFLVGLIVGGLIVGAAWCFWLAEKLRDLRLAGEYSACNIVSKNHIRFDAK